MLQALGVEFLTKEGKNISLGAIGLGELSEIRTENVVPELKDCQFRIACDVENVLCGENGCSAVFGPQKVRQRKWSRKWTYGFRDMRN